MGYYLGMGRDEIGRVHFGFDGRRLSSCFGFDFGLSVGEEGEIIKEVGF